MESFVLIQLFQIRYESLDTKHLWLKLECCEELEKTVNVLEGSMSRTKGFILKSLLDTLYFMKDNSIHIDQVYGMLYFSCIHQR